MLDNGLGNRPVEFWFRHCRRVGLRSYLRHFSLPGLLLSYSHLPPEHWVNTFSGTSCLFGGRVDWVRPDLCIVQLVSNHVWSGQRGLLPHRRDWFRRACAAAAHRGGRLLGGVRVWSLCLAWAGDTAGDQPSLHGGRRALQVRGEYVDSI